MSENLKELIHALSLIAGIKNSLLRAAVLTDLKSNKRLYKALRELAVNVVNGNLSLSTSEKLRLKNFSKIIEELGSKKVKSRRKAKLVQQSGGYLPILIPIVSSILGAVLNGVRK